MRQTFLSAIVVYISTSIDYLFILLILFAEIHSGKEKKQIYYGHYLGTGILVAVSLLAAYVLHFLPEDWMVGLLGLIPLYLGIHLWRKGEEEAEEESILRQLNQKRRYGLSGAVALLTLASGGDNLGIYIPYFTSLAWNDALLVIGIFFILTGILCYLSDRLANISFIEDTIEKYERTLVPIVFIGLGGYIMFENGVFQWLFRL